MVFSKNNAKMFKWNHEKQANGFTANFFFYNNIDSFWRPFPLKFLGKKSKTEKNTTITPFPWSDLSLTTALNRSERENSTSYWKKTTTRFRGKED